MGGEKLRILETRKFYSTFTSHEARPARRHSSRERESTIWGGGARTAHSQRLTSFNFIKFHAGVYSPLLASFPGLQSPNAVEEPGNKAMH